MKKLNTKILKKMFFFILVFMCISRVSASKDFNSKYPSKLYDRCNEDSKCIPICTYAAISSEQYDANATNGEIAYIGYYYSEHAWELAVLIDQELVYTKSKILPTSKIYWSNLNAVEKVKDKKWNKAPEYDMLKNDFKCPDFFTYDEIGANYEMCFSNFSNTCKEQNSTFTMGGTKFEKDRSLKYRYTSDIKNVIEDTYDNLFLFGSDSYNMIYVDPHMDKKINFLLEADASFKKNYDVNKNRQENIKNYCPILAENLKDEDKYFESLTSNATSYKEMVDKQLQESATKLNVRNKEVYNDETLSSLLTLVDSSGNKKYRQINDETGQPYIEKLHSLYAQNTIKSLNYIRETCNATTNTKIEYDEAKLKNKLTTHYESTIYENVNVDIDSTFSCGTLGELADLVKTGYFIIEIIAIVILVVFTALDYAKVILSGEQDEMKKTNKRLATRLIIAVVILLLPALINFVLGVFNIEGFNSENPLCVEIKNK